MKRLMQVVVGAGVVAAMAAPALAEGGCGPGRYRNGPFGHCHWDRPPPPAYYGPAPAYYGPGPGYYGPGPVVVDRWYPGRGYWDGQRYWGHRHHWHGGWRYY
jgi:hypothetical protein